MTLVCFQHDRFLVDTAHHPRSKPVFLCPLLVRGNRFQSRQELLKMSKPHVAMFAGRFTFVQDWAKAAVAAGAEVTLLDEIRGRASGDAPEETHGYSIRHYSRSRQLRPSRYFWPLNDRRNERTMRRLVLDLAVETTTSSVSHLHTHFYPGSNVIARVASDLQIPLVHTEHSSAIINGRISRRGQIALLETAERATSILAVSHPLAVAMRQLGVTTPIQVVPNPVDLDLFSSVERRAEFPPVNGEWHFATIGWLIPGKAHSDIIEAFVLVREQLPGSVLSIVGDGVLRADLEAQARTLGLAGSVRFLGSMDRRRIADVLGAAHCYVHASHAETFGVALVEAWGVGLPVVAYECGGVSGLADTMGGRTLPSRCPKAMSDAMVEQTRSASPEMRARIRTRAEEEFGLIHAVSALQKAYGVTDS